MKYSAGIISLMLFFTSCALLNHGNSNTLSNNPSLEFRCDGIRPECLTASQYGSDSCLRAGGVWINEAIGVSVAKIEKLGGMFSDREKIDEGTGNVTYNFPKEDKDHKPPSITIYYKRGKTAGVRFFGDKTGMDLSFSSIRLGDSEDTVSKVMCKPRKVEAVKDGFVWDYYPVQISVEFKNGNVCSVGIGDCQRAITNY